MLANLLPIFALSIQFGLAATVVSNKDLDCSETNGQIINLDWTACTGEKYDGLSINLQAYSKPPHYYIKRNGNAKIASICVKDQFSEFDLFLDNGKYGDKQQRVFVSTEFDQAYIKMFSYTHNPDGSNIALMPTFVPIRSAQFILNGKGEENQPILSSSSDESVTAYNYRPPNYAINVIYC